MTDETDALTVTLIAFSPMRAGRILGLADVAVAMNGIEWEIHGIQLARTLADGREATMVTVPTYRDPSGRWRPAVVLPPELHDPIADLVYEAALEAGVCRRRSDSVD